MHSFDFDPSHVTRFVDADGTITFQIDLSNSESSVGARQQPRQHSSFNNLLPPTRSAVQFFIKACFKPEQLGRIDGSTLAHCCNILRMIPTLLLALQLTIGNSLILWQNASEHTYTRAFFIQAVFPMVHLCSLPLVFYLCLNRDSIFWKRPSSTASTWVARGLLGLHVFAIWCHKLSDATYKKEYMTTLSSNILIFTVLIMYSMNQKTEHWEFNMYLFLFFGALIWMAFVVWRHSNQGTLLRTLLWLVACDFMPKYVLRMTEVLSGQTMLELFGLSSEFDYPMDWVTYLAHRLALVLYTTKSVVASVLTLGDATAITALTITPDYHMLYNLQSSSCCCEQYSVA